MPEGHSVFIHARDHQKLLAGKRLTVSSPQGRFEDGAREVSGKTLQRVHAHGKHLFYEFDTKHILHIHLGRLGRFREHVLTRGRSVPTPTLSTRVRLACSDAVVDLSGPTACEVLDDSRRQTILDRLGPDLLDPKADRDGVWQTIHRRSTPIGALLMDQSIVSGIGNIFRAEILYLCKIHPATPSDTLTRAQFNRIWREAVRLLNVGVDVGRIVTVPLRSLKKPVEKLRRDERFNVYKRKTCRGCGGDIRTVHLAGRPCYYCTKEQVVTDVSPRLAKSKTR